MTFIWAYMFLLLPLPILVRLGVFRSGNRVAGYKLKIPFFNEIKHIKRSMQSSRSLSFSRIVLLWLAWMCIVAAAARPLQVSDSWSIDVKGRDLMLAIDTSGSMDRPETIDGKTLTRFEVLKRFTSELVEKRQGDRVGIVIFGSRSYLYAPLTFDVKLIKEFIMDLFPGIAGPSTAIGDAIGLSVKYLKDRETKDKVMLLITDGANQGGDLSIGQAVAMAKDAGVKVYAVGIGFSNSPPGSAIKNEQVDLDEPSLMEIASDTGGKYFRADTGEELKEIYARIEQLEAVDEKIIRQTAKEAYHVFLQLAAGLLFLMFLIHAFSIYRENKNREEVKYDAV